MRLSLIINTYNQPDYLARVLAAVSRQSSPPEEVILADDGSDLGTRTVFEQWSPQSGTVKAHAWQSHDGFRRSRILNLAIALSAGDYLVFLDGDTLPHPAFIADHRVMARPAHFVQGHRALIGESAAPWFGRHSWPTDRRRALIRGQLSGFRHAYRWPWPLVRERTDLHGIRGCNLALWRADLLTVNGYNEAFQGWGREDSELAVRLMNNGVRRLDVRGRAACAHLWHPPASRAHVTTNDDLLAAAQRDGARRCAQGLNQHLTPPRLHR